MGGRERCHRVHPCGGCGGRKGMGRKGSGEGHGVGEPWGSAGGRGGGGDGALAGGAADTTAAERELGAARSFSVLVELSSIFLVQDSRQDVLVGAELAMGVPPAYVVPQPPLQGLGQRGVQRVPHPDLQQSVARLLRERHSTHVVHSGELLQDQANRYVGPGVVHLRHRVGAHFKMPPAIVGGVLVNRGDPLAKDMQALKRGRLGSADRKHAPELLPCVSYVQGVQVAQGNFPAVALPEVPPQRPRLAQRGVLGKLQLQLQLGVRQLRLQGLWRGPVGHFTPQILRNLRPAFRGDMVDAGLLGKVSTHRSERRLLGRHCSCRRDERHGGRVRWNSRKGEL
eukprot:RCo014571